MQYSPHFCTSTYISIPYAIKFISGLGSDLVNAQFVYSWKDKEVPEMNFESLWRFFNDTISKLISRDGQGLTRKKGNKH